MSVLTLIWLASFAGALLFAAAGFFAARATQSKEEGPDPLLAAERSRERAELTHALACVQQAEVLAGTARQDAERYARELAQVKETAARAAKELAEAKAHADRAAAQVAEKDEAAARAREALDERARVVARLERELAAAKSRPPSADPRAAETAREIARTNKKLAEVETSLAATKSELEAVSTKERRLADLLDQTRSHARQLEAQLESARKDGEAARREAALRAEETAAAKKAVETARAENTSLRQKDKALTDLRERVVTLEQENERLRAIEFAAKTRPAAPESARVLRAEPSGALDGVSLQRFVDDVVKEPAVSAAAVTDELGFLVVGNGDHAEALAAFGAYLTEAGARACGLLPLHTVQEVSVHDDSGITLTARTIASEPNELVLVTLGVDTGLRREPTMGQRERSS